MAFWTSNKPFHYYLHSTSLTWHAQSINGTICIWRHCAHFGAFHLTRQGRNLHIAESRWAHIKCSSSSEFYSTALENSIIEIHSLHWNDLTPWSLWTSAEPLGPADVWQFPPLRHNDRCTAQIDRSTPRSPPWWGHGEGGDTSRLSGRRSQTDMQSVRCDKRWRCQGLPGRHAALKIKVVSEERVMASVIERRYCPLDVKIQFLITHIGFLRVWFYSKRMWFLKVQGLCGQIHCC